MLLVATQCSLGRASRAGSGAATTLVRVKNPRSAWLIYIVLRLLFFAVPFAVLYVIGIQPWLAAIFAALIGVALSVIFLARSRATASESIYDWRNRDRTADDIIEDEAIDAGADTATDAPGTPAVDADETDAAETTAAAEPAAESATPPQQTPRD